MKSVGQMIKQIAGLRGTKDVTEWEDNFIRGIVEWTDDGEKTSHLTERQVAVVARIYRKHFA